MVARQRGVCLRATWFANEIASAAARLKPQHIDGDVSGMEIHRQPGDHDAIRTEAEHLHHDRCLREEAAERSRKPEAGSREPRARSPAAAKRRQTNTALTTGAEPPARSAGKKTLPITTEAKPR